MEYDLIVKACVDKDIDTVWEIVQDFNLYLMLKCYLLIFDIASIET